MEIIKPFVKWAGGTGSLISQLTTICRWWSCFNRYITKIQCEILRKKHLI